MVCFWCCCGWIVWRLLYCLNGLCRCIGVMMVVICLLVIIVLWRLVSCCRKVCCGWCCWDLIGLCYVVCWFGWNGRVW